MGAAAAFLAGAAFTAFLAGDLGAAPTFLGAALAAFGAATALALGAALAALAAGAFLTAAAFLGAAAAAVIYELDGFLLE